MKPDESNPQLPRPTPPEPTEPNQTRLVLMIFGIAGLLAASGLVLLLFIYVFSGNTEDQLGRDRIERLGHFRFPAETGQVFFHFDAATGTLWVRFAMPARQWRAFVESTAIENFETIEALPAAFGRVPPPAADWWLTATPTNARLGQARADGYTQTVLADFNASARPTVYVIVVQE
ncbi:MAG: hypothetical protein ACFCVE_08020 [Phycisphaerae bacterium]